MHAGYDPKPESRMAPLNRRGIALAKEICDKLHVEYMPMQSLVIAFNEHDMEEVRALYERGLKNGVSVKVLDHDELMKAEPAINPAAIGALWSDDSAIINPWEFATAMAEVAVHALLLRQLHLLYRHGREQTQQRTIRAKESAERTARKYRDDKQHNAKDEQFHITAQTEDSDKGIELTDDESASRERIQQRHYQI